MTVTSTRTALYRLYDAQDELLYVGITKNLRPRLRSHARKKVWWTQVRRQEIAWHDTREDALAAEAEAIKADRPLHNGCFQVGRLPADADPNQVEPGELITINGAARMLGVTKATARQWRRPSKHVESFPPPVDRIGGVDYWWTGDVLAWARRTDRIKEDQTT